MSGKDLYSGLDLGTRKMLHVLVPSLLPPHAR